MLTILTSDRVSIVISPVGRMSAFLLDLQIICKTVLVLVQFQSLGSRTYKEVPLERLHLCQLSVMIHKMCDLKNNCTYFFSTARNLCSTNTEIKKNHIVWCSSKKENVWNFQLQCSWLWSWLPPWSITLDEIYKAAAFRHWQ